MASGENWSLKDLRDNQIVQGQLLHQVEMNLDRLEANHEWLEQRVKGHDERLQRLEEAVAKLSDNMLKVSDGFIVLQSAMQGLSATVDRFIRGLERNGHRPADASPEGAG